MDVSVAHVCRVPPHGRGAGAHGGTLWRIFIPTRPVGLHAGVGRACGRGRRLRDHGADRAAHPVRVARLWFRSEEHTSELQSLMRISYAVFCLKKKKITDG